MSYHTKALPVLTQQVAPPTRPGGVFRAASEALFNVGDLTGNAKSSQHQSALQSETVAKQGAGVVGQLTAERTGHRFQAGGLSKRSAYR
jgi:hypothetical protein